MCIIIIVVIIFFNVTLNTLYFRVNNLDELGKLGLYTNDLNMYDSSRDMVLAGWQHASSLAYSIEQVNYVNQLSPII